MKYIIILLSFLFITQLHAQVPGYYGKRFDIQYRPSLGSLAIVGKMVDSNFDLKNYSYDGLQKTNVLPFNIRHDVAINYIIKKGFSLGVMASIYRTGIVDNSYNNNSDYVPASENINATQILFYYKRFKRSFAPLGKYGGWVIGINNLQAEVRDKDDKLIDSGKAKLLVLGYQGGHQYFIKDGLFFNLGYSILISADVSSTYLTDEIYNRNSLYNAIRVHVGIGYMLF